MRQTTKNNKLDDVGEESITNEIKKNVKKPEWIIIGGKKLWSRKCNFCERIRYYTTLKIWKRSERINGRCKDCIIENPRKGWHHTEETKDVISEMYKGEGNPMYGKHLSEYHKKKLSKKFKGENNPMYGKISAMRGKKHTEESINKQRQKKKDYWISIGHECKDEFIKYRTEVTRLTNKQPIHLLENYDKRGKDGIMGAYHLDHIISVWKGFNKKLAPQKIADINNLQFIPWLDNQKKWYK